MKSSRIEKSRRMTDVISRSPEETQRIGNKIAGLLSIPGVVLLRGDLGTGKTTLTRGIAEGLGLADPGLVNSPSFTLVNIYHGVCPIYHVDLYRLEGSRELYSIGLDDFLGREGVTIIEWSERLKFPFADAIEIEIEDAGDDARVLHIFSPGKNRKARRLSDPPGAPATRRRKSHKRLRSQAIYPIH